MSGEIVAPGGWCAPSDTITDAIAQSQNEQREQFWREANKFMERELRRTAPPRGGIKYRAQQRRAQFIVPCWLVAKSPAAVVRAAARFTVESARVQQFTPGPMFWTENDGIICFERRQV